MSNFIKRYWIYLVVLVVFIWWLQHAISITIENYHLAKSGLTTKARVTNDKWESASYRNEDGFYYVFEVDSVNYTGHTFDMDVKPDDSMDIIYLPWDPDVNRPLDFIERKYK